MSVITTIKVKHCANGDGVNNGQCDRPILSVILMTVKKNTFNNGTEKRCA